MKKIIISYICLSCLLTLVNSIKYNEWTIWGVNNQHKLIADELIKLSFEDFKSIKDHSGYNHAEKECIIFLAPSHFDKRDFGILKKLIRLNGNNSINERIAIFFSWLSNKDYNMLKIEMKNVLAENQIFINNKINEFNSMIFTNRPIIAVFKKQKLLQVIIVRNFDLKEIKKSFKRLEK